jgi:hypothetical protein
MTLKTQLPTLDQAAVVRTLEDRFASIKDFPYTPHYLVWCFTLFELN